eukprot:3940669-Rhodomonas_salina.11
MMIVKFSLLSEFVVQVFQVQSLSYKFLLAKPTTGHSDSYKYRDRCGGVQYQLEWLLSYKCFMAQADVPGLSLLVLVQTPGSYENRGGLRRKRNSNDVPK